MNKIAPLICAIVVCGCSDRNNNISNITATNTGGVIVFCDSMGVGTEENTSWIKRFEDMAGVKTSSNCVGGSGLVDHDIQAEIGSGGYHYGVLALGINDINKGIHIDTVVANYRDALMLIDGNDIIPACFTYPSNGYNTVEFNYRIEELCDSYGYRIVRGSDQIGDYIHFNSAGHTETAVNAWRTLYPE